MYDALTNFLTTFDVEHPILWALLIIAAVAGAAIGFHIFWIIVFRTVRTLRRTPQSRREGRH